MVVQYHKVFRNVPKSTLLDVCDVTKKINNEV